MKRKAAACIGIFCSIIAGTFIADDFCKTRQQTEADNWERFFSRCGIRRRQAECG